jgi:hypothetical protein
VSALLSVGWNPEVRGILTVIIGVVTLCGSVYLLLGTNIGARLGFLVSLAGLFGWMALMGLIWWIYGIGLTGRAPSWEPAEPFSIIREAEDLYQANVLSEPLVLEEGKDFPAIAAATSDVIQADGWTKLPEDDPGRGQAIASSDAIIQTDAELYDGAEYVSVAVYARGGERWPKINESLDFLAFRHEPHYALVEIAPVLEQRDEPGRAPSRPVIDTEQPHQYVLMLRDLGTRRQPAVVLTIGSTLIFALTCWLLHRRDRLVARNRALVPAKA